MEEVGRARARSDEIKNTLQQSQSQNKLIRELNALKSKVKANHSIELIKDSCQESTED